MTIDGSGPPSVSQNAFLGTMWAGVAISSGFLVFRIYVRLKIFRRLFSDDPLVIAGWLMTLANAVVWQMNTGPLYLTIAVNSGEIITLPLDFDEKSFAYLHAQLTSYVLYYTSLYITKLSFLLFFRRLGERVRRQRVIWWSTLFFVIASYAVSFSILDFRCLAGSDAEALVECKSPHAALYEGIASKISPALDIVTDALIVLVSTNILWKVQINLRKKLALAGICSLTALVICVSIIRVVVTTSGAHIDIIKQNFWANLEISIAIIVACLASFRTLYTRSGSQKPASPPQDHSAKARFFRGGNYDLSRDSREGNATLITASEDTHELNPPKSSTSIEEPALPLDGVYVRHDFSVFPEPCKAYIPSGDVA